MELINDPIRIDQDIINREIELIQKEEKSKNIQFTMERLSKKPFKHTELSKETINETLINQQFDYNIKNNKPLFLIAGDTQNERVANAISNVNTRTLKQPKKAPHEHIIFDMKLPE